jgi:hypothetical protein
MSVARTLIQATLLLTVVVGHLTGLLVEVSSGTPDEAKPHEHGR